MTMPCAAFPGLVCGSSEYNALRAPVYVLLVGVVIGFPCIMLGGLVVRSASALTVFELAISSGFSTKLDVSCS